MNNNKIDITVVLDCSGSMSAIKNDAEGGLNRFIEEQKSVPGDVHFTYVTFDSHVHPFRVWQDIKNVPQLSIYPSGCTALLDAVGEAINKTGERLSAIPENDRPGAVLFVIVTDGEENASSKFTLSQIKEMTQHQQEKYNWVFTYLGANQDAFQEGAKLGIAPATLANYRAANTRVMWDTVSYSTTNLRKGNEYAYTISQRANMDATNGTNEA